MIRNASRTTRGFVALGLVIVLVLGATLSVVFVYKDAHPTDAGLSLTSSGIAIPDAEDGKAAVAVADKFLLRYDTFNSTKIEDYVNGISALMTTKFQGDKNATIAALKNQFASSAQALQTKGRILASGISTQDVDSATVLVLHAKETAIATGNFIETDRTQVTLRKVGGKWLVDSVANYRAADQNGSSQ